MKTHHIDFLCLQEVHINSNSQNMIDGYTFIYASGVSDKDRETREKKAKLRVEGKKNEREREAETI